MLTGPGVNHLLTDTTGLCRDRRATAHHERFDM